MPSLDDILNEGTLLRRANAGRSSGVGVPHPLPQPLPDSEKENEQKPVWHYKTNFMTNSSRLDQITDLTCKVRGMGFMAMPVCKSIEWGPVDIEFGGNTHRLPMTFEFQVMTEYLDRGFVPDSSTGIWQLEMNVDQSFQTVFAYDFGPLTGVCSLPKAVPENVRSRSTFMPDSRQPGMPIAAVCGSVCTVEIPNLYVVMVLSFVCCKENNNFEPGGVLQAGRFFPLIQVMANHPLDKILANVTIRRPPNIPPGHENMDGEIMLPPMRPEFFADRNDRFGPPATWQEIFSHYWIDPPNGKYVMVDPALPARTIHGAVENGGVTTVVAPFLVEEHVFKHPFDIAKVQGQGEFDNLHIAPKMVAPEKIRKRYPNEHSFDEIAMAPFCVHDCLHTHTRWSSADSAKHVRGWDGFTPNSKPGMPLVPPNQKITIELLTASEFRYVAEVVPMKDATAIPSGRWQVVFHHGSAYALAVNWKGQLAKNALYALLGIIKERIFDGENGTWAMFYWHLRFSAGLSKNIERVLVIDLAKARS